jgi:DNA-binding transcriptional ArsR family regulator
MALNNRQIVLNYVAMPDRMQWCAADVACATGIPESTVRHELLRLSREGVITRIVRRVDGRAYYRASTEADAARREAETGAGAGAETAAR